MDSYTYDALGRLTNDGTRTYIWDLASRLTSYTESGNTVSFTYDALGRRLSRTDAGVTRNFVWNEALGLTSISIERQGAADLRYYVHTPGGRLLYGIDATSNARNFYHFDEMGNTLFVTDDAGTVIGSNAYTPYGEVMAATGVPDNPFTWQGQLGVMQEGDSGLYYLRARYYDSATGRFISRDTKKSIAPKRLNPYQYALNNPLRFVDVNGLDPNEPANNSENDEAGKAILQLTTAPDSAPLISALLEAVEDPEFEFKRPDPTTNDAFFGISLLPGLSDREANLLYLNNKLYGAKEKLRKARRALRKALKDLEAVKPVGTGFVYYENLARSIIAQIAITNARFEILDAQAEIRAAQAAFEAAGGTVSIVFELEGIVVLN